MKRYIWVTVILLVIGMLIPGAVSALPEEVVWESYTTGTTEWCNVTEDDYCGQTFTIATESHTVTRVRLVLQRVGTPGDFTVGIHETDPDGLPTFVELASGTYDGNLVDPAISYVTVTMDTPVTLEYGELYAIVVTNEAGDTSNHMRVYFDPGGATYTGGRKGASSDGGSSWSMDADGDMWFAVIGQALLEVSDAKAFRGYMEDGDMLFTVAYYDVYAPQYPEAAAGSSFYLQLRDTDAVTVLAQTNLPAWGYRPGSIYLSANQCATLTEGALYDLWIVGTMAEAPTANYTLVAGDWHGTNLVSLDSWVITWAKVIGDYYATDMTTYISEGEVLNDIGSVLFTNGIPLLASVRPGIFETTLYSPGWSEGTTTHPYETATTWDAVVGTSTATALNSIGNIVGISGRHVGAFGLVLLYGLLCVLIVGRGGNGLVAAILAIPIIVAGAWLHLIDIAFVSIVAAIAVLMTMFRFWFSRT